MSTGFTLLLLLSDPTSFPACTSPTSGLTQIPPASQNAARTAMLNSKALSELLSKNSDGRLCKRWFIMTPNGTLLAYTRPSDIRDLRRQAAVAAMSWLENSEEQTSPTNLEGAESRSPSVAMTGLLRTLTVETVQANLIIRKLQPRMLLVLEGGVPPRKRAFEQKITPEGPGDTPYPGWEGGAADSVPGSSASSVAESTKTSASRKTLALQRRKLDALASAIASDFERTGFRMPDDDGTKLL